MAKSERTGSGGDSSWKAARPKLPPGVTLGRVLSGHTDAVTSVAFDPQGGTLASGSHDTTVKLWDVASGRQLRSLEGHKHFVRSVAFDRQGGTLASGSVDKTVKLWDVASGRRRRSLDGHMDRVLSVAFDPQGGSLASGSGDTTVKLWDVASGQLLRTLDGHTRQINSVAFDRQGGTLTSGSADNTVKLWDVASGRLLRSLEGHTYVLDSVAFDRQGGMLASGSADNTVKLWDVASGRLLRSLEGHTGSVDAIAFSPDGSLLASKSDDQTIRLWSCATWETVAVIPVPTSRGWFPALAFHPDEQRERALLATASSLPNTPESERCREIHLYELDLDVLLGKPAPFKTRHYVNAKVVLVGDTGVGKSGLSLVLNGKDYKETDSTAGRYVWPFDSHEVELADHRKQTRETLLWDLAGQPGYRVIHQLHLNEVAVALVVFDARSEIDPLAGVTHWSRALRLAQQRQGPSAIPMKKFLVSARNDRGGVSVSKERLEAIQKEFGFDGYFETSAREGWKIKELRAAIEDAIAWDVLPIVTSEELFVCIKSFLMSVKDARRLLVATSDLYGEFLRQHEGEQFEFELEDGGRVLSEAHQLLAQQPNHLQSQFDTCVSRLENRDLIRRLSFGGHVLLQPELLDAYASAMVNAAKNEPDGLGSIAEDAALDGQFFVPKEQKVGDRGQEQVLLNATVEELVRHDLALRESASDGRYLVFPSQFNRDYEDAPEPPGREVAITFDGPVQHLYSTLAVRLGHSGMFTTGRSDMWRNAAVFTARTGGKCGLYLHEFAEARGRLVIFYDAHNGRSPSDETRFHFEEFVSAHVTQRAIQGSISLVRFFICSNCGDPVPDSYVKRLRDRGLMTFDCPCGGQVSLAAPQERLQFPSQVEAMGRAADRQRDFEVFVESARGETRTKSFSEWAGGERATLAIVFTDLVGSTAMENELGGEQMNETRRAHFAQGRRLLDKHAGREIKTIGDAFMAAFKSVDEALDFAMELHTKPGDPQIKVRAGVHIGAMTVEAHDVFGGTVNFAARVVGAIKGAEIWLSEESKRDIDQLRARRFDALKWQRHDGVEMKGFPGSFTLWSLEQ